LLLVVVVTFKIIPFQVCATDPAFPPLLQAPLEVAFMAVNDCSSALQISWKRHTGRIAVWFPQGYFPFKKVSERIVT
jgi:hypothetical protein